MLHRERQRCVGNIMENENIKKNHDHKFYDELFARMQDLLSKGIDPSKASKTAWLEQRISIWKNKWGDNFWIFIYGDFRPPQDDYRVDELGITIHAEKIENSVVNHSATCVLKATVELEELTIPSLMDAIRRINILLGSWVLVTWGNAPCRWWSWVTHDSGGGVVESIKHKDLDKAITGVISLRPEIRKKVDAALYWIREPRNLLLETPRSDLLRVYVSYWNAFECLVEAVNLLRPQNKLSKKGKQKLLDDYFASLDTKPTPGNISECYKKVIDPGFKAKAINALNVCFGEKSQIYIDECFDQPNEEDNLYQIRNSINHGDIDAENLKELIRIEARLSKLWVIVWGMFGRLVPFPAPVI